MSEPGAHPVAVLVCRAGQPPVGADEAVAEAGGAAIVAGQGAREAAERLTAAYRVWTIETPIGLQVTRLAHRLALLLADSPLVILPASPDGRDLAPRLAAVLDRSLLAGAMSVGVVEAPIGEVAEVLATMARLDNRLALPVRVNAPVIATLPAGLRSFTPAVFTEITELPALAPPSAAEQARVPDVEVLEVLEPDAATMDLAEAPRVVACGAGLVPPGSDDVAAHAVCDLLVEVAAALGASAGATRVITDVGWFGFERQIGTTGVMLDPDLYLALGISGAVQHIGGIGTPAHVVSVNTDPSCPMTAAATLGLVTDARALLAELASRLGVPVPPEAGLPDPGLPAVESTVTTSQGVSA
jgi:electron transfer flavoprotein alpha subunit